MLAAVAEPHLSLYQASCRTGISRYLLLSMIARGQLPAVVMGGRVFVGEADLGRIADAAAREPGPDVA
jgi:hypothetical protein